MTQAAVPTIKFICNQITTATYAHQKCLMYWQRQQVASAEVPRKVPMHIGQPNTSIYISAKASQAA